MSFYVLLLPHKIHNLMIMSSGQTVKVSVVFNNLDQCPDQQLQLFDLNPLKDASMHNRLDV